jgi:hypothetical protein
MADLEERRAGIRAAAIRPGSRGKSLPRFGEIAPISAWFNIRTAQFQSDSGGVDECAFMHEC